MKNIIIYGMRGTGKSTVGRELSKRLNKEFIDLDTYIVDKIGETVEVFVSKYGWDGFRDMEHTCLKEVLELNNKAIISLGGGTIAFERNQKLVLKNNYKLIYVYSDLDNIITRVEQDTKNTDKRPSLTGKPLKEDLKEIYNKRKDTYEKFYDLKVDNNNLLEDCIDLIVKKLKFGNICIPIVDFENDLDDRINIINNSRQVKYAELRIDFLDDLNKLENIISKIDKQIILTNRIEKEGGKFKGNSKENIEILSNYINKINYVDFELQNGDYINELKEKLDKKQLILSYHDFNNTPTLDELKKVLGDMSKYNPDVYKIAVMPKDEKDVEIIEELSRYFKSNYNRDFIFISMGELGKKTRINLSKNGGLLTFGSLGLESAPGQIRFDELYDLIFN